MSHSDTGAPGLTRQRRAGVLLHPSSFPGVLENGDIGHESYRFIEFLHANGFKVWQMLPLGPTHNDRSPYQCLSSHAGNPLLISLDWLRDRGWLKAEDIQPGESSNLFRYRCLKDACGVFFEDNDETWIKRFEAFIQEHKFWLDDFALYTVIRQHNGQLPWYEWPAALRHREPQVLQSYRQDSSEQIKEIKFQQFIFFCQWLEVREYAAVHGIELFGDVPIFVAHDSADVWACRENFLMDTDGQMEYVAGVPPDAFSDTGQRWGNPLYDWQHLQATKFSWWVKRFETQLKLFDMVRIDHFRGLQACWQIPANEHTAENGQWVEVPGEQLLQQLQEKIMDLPVIAEDLGVITDKVIALKNKYHLPGMKVLQFAFDGNTHNPHLSHRHYHNDIVYTGTHDNNTSLGWIGQKELYNHEYFLRYLGVGYKNDKRLLLELIRQAMASVSFLCILPMQDILMLNSQARMNTPGTIENNWQWRFDWSELQQKTLKQIAELIKIYERV